MTSLERSAHTVSETACEAALASDLLGAGRLIVDAVTGVTDLVESMHRNISGLAPIVGPSRRGRTRGVTGLVYRSVRGVSRIVGSQLDFVLPQLVPLLGSRGTSPRFEAGLAALNGVLGDYLDATGNPLSISMGMRRQGRALALDRQALQEEFPRPPDKLVVLVHGLCMNDLQWRREKQSEEHGEERGEEHDHGATVARDLGYAPLYLHYNSGLHISTNGRKFADLLEELVREWPVPVRELAVIGYSMGGLVARSACHYASLAGHTWPRHLNKLVFLGTPHHGAPLERVGNWASILLGVSPYSAPFVRLGKVRSAGIQDLRYGNLVDADWQNVGTEHTQDPRQRVPLPKGAECFAIAASRHVEPGHGSARPRGDGFVSVKSALGEHRDPDRSLPIPASSQSLLYGLRHFDLLSSREVGHRVHRWLAEGGHKVGE